MYSNYSTLWFSMNKIFGLSNSSQFPKRLAMLVHLIHTVIATESNLPWKSWSHSSKWYIEPKDHATSVPTNTGEIPGCLWFLIIHPFWALRRPKPSLNPHSISCYIHRPSCLAHHFSYFLMLSDFLLFMLNDCSKNPKTPRNLTNSVRNSWVHAKMALLFVKKFHIHQAIHTSMLEHCNHAGEKPGWCYCVQRRLGCFASLVPDHRAPSSI